MPAIDLVVFDMAGTTVHDRDGVNRCLREALEVFGLEAAPAEVNRVMGLPKPEAIALLIDRYGRGDDLGPRVEEIHRDFLGRSIAFYGSDPSVHEVTGASAVFDRIRSEGIRVALNTGFHRAIVDVILDRLDWRRRIDASIASDEADRGRPHPDMIRALMQHLGVTNPSRVAKVGDTPADLEEGRNAGCGLIVGVTSGTHTREQLEICPHTHLIDDIREFPELLGLS
jgi:phosphonatase-like hydrolase